MTPQRGRPPKSPAEQAAQVAVRALEQAREKVAEAQRVLEIAQSEAEHAELRAKLARIEAMQDADMRAQIREGGA